MQLGVRDRVLGWTVDGLLELIQEGVATDAEVLHALVRRLKEDFSLVYSEDLPVEGRLPETVPDSLLSWLRGIEEAELKKRAEGLKGDPRADDRLSSIDEDPDLVALAQTPLFRAKRAKQVRELLRCRP